MKKPAIPPVPKEGESRARFDQATKEALESIMGRRGSSLTTLTTTASLDDCIAKINEIIGALQ